MGRSPTSTARSTRSTRRRASSRCWSTCSAVRRPSSWTCSRWKRSISVPPPKFLASARPRRPGAFGAEACVEGPGAASSRICAMRSSARHPLLGSGRRCRGYASDLGVGTLVVSKKKIRTVLKLELQARRATPAPPVGTALGPHGINIMEFTKAYNERTQAQSGDVVPAEITIYEDRTFTFILKTPPTVNLLKRAAGIEKGSPKPNREKVGRVTMQQVRQIVETKRKDLNAYETDAAIKMIEGTARSMGLEVVE